MKWNFYEDNTYLKPLCFSNGKTQEDVVEEILELIKKGRKIIFLQGVCGTGKSAIALNLASHLGKTSIIVPGKNLQAQYKGDYHSKKYFLKSNGEKLKISIITGRNNHKCKFLEDNEKAIPRIRREINANLYDIFKEKKEETKEFVEKDISAANNELPCKIEIKEKNWFKIKQYLKKNEKVQLRDFASIKDVKRLSIAPVCPYWSPVFPERYELKSLNNVKKESYEGLKNTNFIFYQRKPGCPFYEQFKSYLDADVLIFNALKYKLETELLRKPKTEIEIIDECDEFLDSFSNEKKINIDRLQNTLIQVFGAGEGDEKFLEELLELIKYLKKETQSKRLTEKKEILSLKSTGLYDIFKIFLKENWLDSVDDESYLFDTLETAKMFAAFMEESYVTFTKSEKGLIAQVVTTNLAKKLKQLVDKNKILVLMSGTLHSEDVLKSIFGLKDFEKVEAETEEQGKIEIIKTGFEMDCKYSNFSSKKFTRENYLKALNESLKKAPRPTLVHINAFLDLPSETEIEEYNLKYLLPREKIREMQIEDKSGKLTKEFREGKTKILFSTKDSRGIDFPGNQCNSIVFTKYPNPNVQNAFWKILMKTKPQNYWAFYKDKAKREFLQKIYRGLRYKEDHIYLLSPDIRVLDKAKKEFKRSTENISKSKISS